MHRRILGLVASLVLLLTLAAPAAAIVYGEPDVDNHYDNVGAIIAEFEGELFNVCTGTLINTNVVLTAAHCIFGERMGVTFLPNLADVDPATDIFWGTAVPHPLFACCGANDTYDIAVIVLDDDVAGIPIAPVATPNQLGEMSAMELRTAVFETAGYGAIRDVRQGAFQPIYADSWRHFATQTANSLTKAWFTLSMNQATGNGGTCYGDSGGPHFLDGVVVSLTVTGDRWCKSTDKTYRLDSPVSQAFLAPYLP
jgi:secreted trypsin-like serine protease